MQVPAFRAGRTVPLPRPSSPIMVDFRLIALDRPANLREEWRQIQGEIGEMHEREEQMRMFLKIVQMAAGCWSSVAVAALAGWLYRRRPS